MTADPALAFWVRFAESEGALSEQRVGATTMLLPPALQEAFDLPEELLVTADPEVAREDGALLMAPGHPVLDGAAGRVLEAGDVGRITLAWPAAGQAPLSSEALVERIRSHVVIDHGRIDATPDLPAVGYLPVLRVGALVTYTVTLDDRFQERQEVWVDATTALPVPPALVASLAASPDADVVAHRVLPTDRSVAAAAAQQLLERGAEARLAALGRQSQGAREAEVARVEAYYAAALESLDRRRSGAAPERQAVLATRAEATRAERERRLSEVEEKFRGSVETQWYRVHELLVPAATVKVTVRRGSREYPFAFRWLLHQRAVAPFTCPHCSSAAPLVAGKERLGCEQCLAKPAPSPVPSGLAVAGVPELPAKEPAPAPTARLKRSDAPPPSRPGASGGSAARAPDKGPRVDRDRLSDAGAKQVLKFWQAVAGQDRRVARLVLPGSPADVAVQLWGSFGPSVMIGLPVREQPREVDVRTFVDPEAQVQFSTGQVIAERNRPAYTVRWLGGAAPHKDVRVAEVVGGMTRGDARLPAYQLQAWWRVPRSVAQLPPLRVQLDPVAAELWRVELTGRGAPVLLRCLAAWWRTQALLSSVDPAVAAASVARAVAVAAGAQVTFADVAGDYAADPAAVRAAAPDVRRVLALSPELGW